MHRGYRRVSVALLEGFSFLFSREKRYDAKAPLPFDESMRRVFATWKDSGVECSRDAQFEGGNF